VLATVTRGGVVESVHRGSLIALAADGSTVLELGEPHRPVFPRSALKPLQLAGMLRAGLDRLLRPGADDDLLAVAAASHAGEPRHRAAVLRLLARAGLDETALRNRPLLPKGEAARTAVLRSGGGPSALAADCSGKHAAMLATCVASGAPLEGYLAPESPVQRAVRAEVERATGEPAAAVTVDGCGAPLLAVSLTGLARALAAAAVGPADSPGRVVLDAMRAHPGLVGGTGRSVTALMAGVPGLAAKEGAEGVMVATTGSGAAVALKLDDGAARGRAPVLVAALRALGESAPELRRWATEPVLGGNAAVGEVAATLGPPAARASRT
jgi:L-asparaginase II